MYEYNNEMKFFNNKQWDEKGRKWVKKNFIPLKAKVEAISKILVQTIKHIMVKIIDYIIVLIIDHNLD